MPKPLTHRELDFLRPAILERKEIFQSASRKTAYWDGERSARARVAVIGERLIELGYLARYPRPCGGYILRPTRKALDLRCTRCVKGWIRQGGKKAQRCADCYYGLLSKLKVGGKKLRLELHHRDREYLKPAVLEGMEIHDIPPRKRARWNNEYLYPVRVGVVAEKLIRLGYLERVPRAGGGSIIRATKKALNLRCTQCVLGFVKNEDQLVEKCRYCDGGIRY